MVGLIVAGVIWIRQEIVLVFEDCNLRSAGQSPKPIVFETVFLRIHGLPLCVLQSQFFYFCFEGTVLEFNLAYHWRAHPLHSRRSVNGYSRVRFELCSSSPKISTDLFNTLPAGSRLKFNCACFVEVWHCPIWGYLVWNQWFTRIYSLEFSAPRFITEKVHKFFMGVIWNRRGHLLDYLFSRSETGIIL